MIEQVVLYVIGFIIFCVLQSLSIHGIYYAFSGGCLDQLDGSKFCNGSIFYKISPSFFEKNRGKCWTMPLWGCYKCMASFWGFVTFWGTVLPLFGFYLFEIWVFIFNVFILVSINSWIYKKI